MVRASGGASGPRAQIGRRLRGHDAPNACHSRRMAVPSGSSCRPPRTTSTRRRRLPCDGLAVVRIPRTAISQTVGELTARLRELLEAFLIYPHRDVPGVDPVLRRDGADGAPSSSCDRRRADRAAGEGSVFESGIHSCMDGYPVAGGATSALASGRARLRAHTGRAVTQRASWPADGLTRSGRRADQSPRARPLAHADDCMSHRSERVGRCVPALELDEVRASSPTVGSLSQCAREGAARAPRRRELEQARRVRKGSRCPGGREGRRGRGRRRRPSHSISAGSSRQELEQARRVQAGVDVLACDQARKGKTSMPSHSIARPSASVAVAVHSLTTKSSPT
jgi:hypothetical protein